MTWSNWNAHNVNVKLYSFLVLFLLCLCDHVGIMFMVISVAYECLCVLQMESRSELFVTVDIFDIKNPLHLIHRHVWWFLCLAATVDMDGFVLRIDKITVETGRCT